jgi:hypothetical protein
MLAPREAIPLTQWLRRLHVIMIIDKQGLVTFAFAFTKDSGAICGHDLGFEAALLSISFDLRAFF